MNYTKLIITCIFLFIFMTAADHRSKIKPMNYEYELSLIRIELAEAEQRNQKLQEATQTDSQIRKIKRRIKRNQ